MKKTAVLLILALLLGAVPFGAASALDEQTPQEQVVGKFIFEGYWDIWGANGKWVGIGYPGAKNLACDSDEVYPGGLGRDSEGLKRLLASYELTRAEVKYVYPFGEAEYNDAGKRYGRPWSIPAKRQGFYWEDYRTMPDNLRAEIKSFDPKTGATTVKWILDYPVKPNPFDPTSPPTGPEDKAANTKNWLRYGQWDKIDYRYVSPEQARALQNNKALEGWRVYFLAIVW